MQGMIELGRAFGGRVFQGSVEDVEKVYADDAEAFTKSGQISFLKANGIPVSFFNRQTEKTQQDLLVAQKHHLRTKSDHLLYLKDNEGEKIVFVAPQTPHGWQDPADTLGVNPSVWDSCRLDHGTGVVRYTQRSEKVDRGEYFPALFLDIPILYWGRLGLNAGLYKMICTNGMTDTVFSSQFRLNLKKQSLDMLSAIVVNSSNALAEFGNPYQKFLNHLQSVPLSFSDARSLLGNMREKSSVPNTLIKWGERHVDQIEAQRDVDAGSPTKVECEYDVLDTLTFHAQKLPSVRAQSSAEGGVFSFFYGQFRDRVGRFESQIKGCNVKGVLAPTN